MHQWNLNDSRFNRTCYSHPVNDVSSLAIVILLTNLDIVIVAGNLLVLLALAVDRRLRTPTHYFIGSLAGADLALGIFVVPVAIAFESAGAWIFGIPLCQLWLAVDVFLCTASIYGLLGVAMDRYIAVTRPLTYKSFMTHKRASLIIAIAWSISLIICLPTFVVSSYRASKAVESCSCSQMIHGWVYIVYSAVGSFYLPMAIIGYVYMRIYRTIRQIKLQGVSGVVNIDYVNSGGSEIATQPKDAPASKASSIGSRISSCKSRLKRSNGRLNISRSVPTRMTMRVHKGGYREDQTTPLLNRKQSERQLGSPLLDASCKRSVSTSSYVNLQLATTAIGHKRRINNNGAVLSPANSSPTLSQSTLLFDASASEDRTDTQPTRNISTTSFMGFLAVPTNITSIWYQRMDAFHRYHQKLTSELGALRTVGIVTGCFVACWIGFCVVYSIHALPQCRFSNGGGGSPCVPEWVITAMVWLGYANSAANPIIYAASNENFRRAFRMLLRCRIDRKGSGQ